jgi:hypothetical protein
MTYFNAHDWLLDRRHVLRGVGASIALPLLDCMLRARPTEVVGKPKRSVFIYVPNGVNTLDWQIQSAGPDYKLTQPLQSLEKHRGNFTPFSGLHHPNAIGQNHKCDKIWLTGARIASEGGDFRNTVSADQLMAEVAGVHTRFPSLELTITSGTLAWSRDGVPLPAERKPSATFERLFGVTPGGVDAERRRLRRRASVLDVILDDARSFRRTIGVEDRSKLDEYLGAVRDVELRTERADAWLDVEKPEVEPDLRAHLTRNIPDVDAGDYYRTVYDLMLLALRTDMVRVITCMSGSESHGLAIPEIGIQQTRHELSHHGGNPERMQRLTRTDTFLVEQLAYFLDQLQAVDEQGEALLDRTMVLFGSGMAYGHSHGNANLPTLLAGGRALGLEHGRHIDYNLPKIGKYDVADAISYYPICLQPVDGEARLSNLLLTMLQQMDVETETFADSLQSVSEIVA